MTLEETQEGLAKMAETCEHPEYKAAADYIAQITHQSLLGFMHPLEYRAMVKEVHQQVIDAEESEFKNQLNTLIESLLNLLDEALKAQENKEVSEA
jgi:hypothetical protein